MTKKQVKRLRKTSSIFVRDELCEAIKAKVNSLIQQNVPIETTVVDIDIPTAVAEKTFLEKAFLLHELFSTGVVRDADRKSRHLYDLAMMMKTDIAANAIDNDELWNTIHHHRETLTSMKGVDYTPDLRKRICLVPSDSMISDWQKDYNDMCSSMIMGISMMRKGIV